MSAESDPKFVAGSASDPSRNAPSVPTVAGSTKRPVSEPLGKGHLPRLARAAYQGQAAVHWTFTLQNRARGWLTPGFHQIWQLTLLHTCARHQLVSPLYVLMPDHAHLLLLGLHADSDQWLATNFLRRHTRGALAPQDWQKQTHDHVLSEAERSREGFASVAHYIRENPVRAGLVSEADRYPYLGNCVPGYPDFNPNADDYWERFWRCHGYLVGG